MMLIDDKLKHNKELWIRANVALQVCLHLNRYLIGVWMASQYFSWKVPAQPKHLDQDGPSQAEVIAFLWKSSFLLFCITEMVRLYSGNAGNLTENTKHMLAFVFVSVCLQVPNHIFRMVYLQCWQFSLLPHIIVNLVHFVLLLLEICLGMFHLHTIFTRIYQLELHS